MSSSSPSSGAAAAKARQATGLGYWMRRVLEECDKAGMDFAADSVHDLRVALRRCRSMADGWMAVDPSREWKRMKKAAKELFRALGELRDSQVMTEWVERLDAPEDPVGKALAAYAGARERQLKQQAAAALEDFDRKRWAEWGEILPRRAARVKPGSPIFLHMALERWTEAHGLHGQALRNRTRVAVHRLRIGLKRLRYTAENFLPRLHELWRDDLKQLQDLLGEVHDLDVLWQTAVETKAFPDDEWRVRWQAKISEQRTSRIEKYREKMVGRNSLWKVWRAELPEGEQVKSAALARLKVWASFLDPDFRHSQRVSRLALQLYDGLAKNGLIRRDGNRDWRSILQAAALLHDVGRSKGAKKHHKASSGMVRKLDAPLGWAANDLQIAGLIARYHRGSIPRTSHRDFARLTAGQQKRAALVAGILRLADALDAEHNGMVRGVVVSNEGAYLVAEARGYSVRGQLAERVASARYLLELVYERPVIVRPARAPRKSRVGRG